MAEYITKEEALLIIDRDKRDNLLMQAEIRHVRSSDVIERSKVNKAIEDMKFNIKCNTDQRTGRVNLLGQGQMMMLDILKKYIGE